MTKDQGPRTKDQGPISNDPSLMKAEFWENEARFRGEEVLNWMAPVMVREGAGGAGGPRFALSAKGANGGVWRTGLFSSNANRCPQFWLNNRIIDQLVGCGTKRRRKLL